MKIATFGWVWFASAIVSLSSCDRDAADRTGVEIPVPSLAGMETPVAVRIEDARSALKRDSRSATAWGHLGAVYDAHGLAEEAVACYRQAATLDRDDVRWPYLAGVVLATEDPTACFAWFERAIELDTQAAVIRQMYADALARAGRDDAAETQYRQALVIDPRWRRALLGLAELALRRGEPDEALRLLEQAADLDFCDREVHAKLARVHRRRGDVAAAQREALLVEAYPDLAPIVDPMRTMVSDEESSSKARTKRGLGYVAAKRYPEAEREFRLALEARPDNMRNRLNLGGVLHRQGRVDEALAIYREAVARDADNADAHNNLAVVLTDVGDTEGALRHLDTALRLAPDNSEAHFNRGRVLLIRERRDEGVAALERAIETSPVNVMAHNELGRQLLTAGRLDEAERHFRDAVECGCFRADATVNLAMVCAQQGRFGEAIAALRRGLTRAPQDEMLMAALATILATGPDARYRNGPEAVELANRLVARNGQDHVPSLNLLAAALAEQGDYPAAVRTSHAALAQAQRRGRADLVDIIRSRLTLYESGRPYHQGGRN